MYKKFVIVKTFVFAILFASFFNTFGQTISGPSIVCLGAATTYTVTGLGGCTVDGWIPNGGSTSGGNTGTTVTIYWSSPGAVSVSLGYSCSGTSYTLVKDDITVLGGVAFSAQATASPSTICKGGATTLSVTTSPSVAGTLSYQWSTGATSQSLIVSPAANTSYTVQVTDQCGNPSVQGGVAVTVVSSPTAVNISSSTSSSICNSPVKATWKDVLGCNTNSVNGDIIKTAATAWGNSGAASNETISNGGYVEALANDDGSYKMLALIPQASATTYSISNTIKYGMYFRVEGYIEIYENGVALASPHTGYQANGKFRIAVENNVVKYYKNDVVFYTSTQAPTLPLRLNTILYTVNAEFDNINIRTSGTGATVPVFTATATGGTTPLNYQWRIDGVNIAGANAQTYSTTALNDGSNVTCIVSNAFCTGTNSNTITLSIVSKYPYAGANEFVGVQTPAYSLSGMKPAVGVWTAQTGLTTAGVFTPSVAGLGVKTLTYNYTLTGCTFSSQKQITVTPSPTGATISNPILAGTFIVNNCSPYQNIQNNDPANGFGNEYSSPTYTNGQASDDIYYKFIVQYGSPMYFSACSDDGSSIYMHIVGPANASYPNGVYLYEKNNACIQSGIYGFVQNLDAGTYYLVVEGNGTNHSTITTIIQAGGSDCRLANVANIDLVDTNAPTNNDFVVFPNPAKDKIEIQFSQNDLGEENHVKIYDMTGRLVYENNTSDNQMSVDIHALPEGIYFINQIRSDNIKRKKIEIIK